MSLRVYNSMSRSKETFVPRNEKEVSMYVCGVTVYDRSHIGHARCYVAFDLVYRYLSYLGYDVNYIRNFTDVDDKIIKRANEEGIGTRELTTRNIELFHKDMEALGCRVPSQEPRVSDHMAEIIAIIESIIDNGHAYEADGTVYFHIDSFDGYGKLSGRKLEDMKAGASDRVEADPNKKSPWDFVLWKPAKEGEPSWESPWGNGRPGWHIECSAMSMKYLGSEFDIHGGGKDLVFPHHENEIAQSEAASGSRKFVNYWMHNGFVNIDEEKMSKSLGNFFTIETVLEQYHPQAVRLFLLGTHYRSPLNYSTANLDEATARLEYFCETVLAVKKAIDAGGREGGEPFGKETLDNIVSKIDESLADDFNSALALGHLYELMHLANETVKKKKKTPGRLETLKRTLEVGETISGILGILEEDVETTHDRIRELDIGRL